MSGQLGDRVHWSLLRERDEREYPSIAVNRVYVRPLSPAIGQESITVRRTTTAFVDMIFSRAGEQRIQPVAG
jgi:hypothetical protein